MVEVTPASLQLQQQCNKKTSSQCQVPDLQGITNQNMEFRVQCPYNAEENSSSTQNFAQRNSQRIVIQRRSLMDQTQLEHLTTINVSALCSYKKNDA